MIQKQGSPPSGGARRRYVWFDSRVPASHREWVKEDIDSGRWFRRARVRTVVSILSGAALATIWTENAAVFFGFALGAPMTFAVLTGRKRAMTTAARSRHGV